MRTLIRCVVTPIALVVAVVLSLPASGSPTRGVLAPDIRLNDLNGIQVSTADLTPRTLVLIFGTLPHEGVQRACTQVLDAVHDHRLIGDVVVPILVVPDLMVSQPRSSEEMPSRLPAITLHDPDREAFKAYKVVVVPTVVVVSARGQVVNAIAGYNPRFHEMLMSSLLFAAGRESRAEFERVVDAKVQQVGPNTVRAARLTQMGDELMEAGLFGWAASRYSEACLLDPTCSASAIGAGAAMLRLRQYDDAVERIGSVLAWAPDSTEAKLGLAEVEFRRGGDVVKLEAELQAMIEACPTHAGAHRLLGELLERRGDTTGAIGAYRRAADLALGNRVPE